MGPTARINLGLLLLVLGLLALAWYDLRSPERATEPPPLTMLPPATIREIRISGPGGEIAMVRGTDGWEMMEPYRIAADPRRVEQLLEITTAYSLERFPLPLGGERGFGLEPPLARVVLDGVGIKVGTTQPVTHQRYLQIGESVHLINDRFPHLIFAAPEEYISPRLLPEGAMIRAIATAEWRLARGSGGQWHMEPAGRGLAHERLERFLAGWHGARAGRIEPATGSGDGGWIEVELERHDGPIRFSVTRDAKGLRLLREGAGIAYRLPPDSPLLEP